MRWSDKQSILTKVQQSKKNGVLHSDKKVTEIVHQEIKVLLLLLHTVEVDLKSFITNYL